MARIVLVSRGWHDGRYDFKLSVSNCCLNQLFSTAKLISVSFSVSLSDVIRVAMKNGIRIGLTER